jgi:hypothetical protein
MAKRPIKKKDKASAPAPAPGVVVAEAKIEGGADLARELAERLGTPKDPIPGAQVQPPNTADSTPSNVVNMHERRPKASEEAIHATLVERVTRYMVSTMNLDEAAAREMAEGLDPEQLGELGREAQLHVNESTATESTASVLGDAAAHQAAGAPAGVPLKPSSASDATPPAAAAASTAVPQLESLVDPVAVEEFRSILQDHQMWKSRQAEAESKLDDLNADIMARLSMLKTKSVKLDQFRITGYFGVNVQLSKTRLLERGVDPAAIAAATVRNPNQRPTVQVIDLTKTPDTAATGAATGPVE